MCETEKKAKRLKRKYRRLTKQEWEVIKIVENTGLKEEYIEDSIWTSSDTNIAQIDKDGLVQPCSNGSAVIFLTQKDLIKCIPIIVELKK